MEKFSYAIEVQSAVHAAVDSVACGQGEESVDTHTPEGRNRSDAVLHANRFSIGTDEEDVSGFLETVDWVRISAVSRCHYEIAMGWLHAGDDPDEMSDKESARDPHRDSNGQSEQPQQIVSAVCKPNFENSDEEYEYYEWLAMRDGDPFDWPDWSFRLSAFSFKLPGMMQF
eukprot:CAMPEP_0170644102 /NCGR_PEP_ID=MMETSP0224-20130122/42283_1 /TAXON_ID=285029 /ORGANISM="Togula jolla, Strain CCCM 725" /LENGTH=170 /DNA_ID=CAMNT_0010975061 /DNA_START=57 /DNA_END=569 /DNA_ORIENTATION=+